MVKKLLLLLMCILMLAACGAEKPVDDQNVKIELLEKELIMPAVIDTQLADVEFIDDSHLMLAYYEVAKAGADNSLLVEYDLVGDSSKEVYNGILSNNFFYDVDFRKIDIGLTIQTDIANDKILVYDGELTIADVDTSLRFSSLLSDNSRVVCDWDAIRIYKGDGSIATIAPCDPDRPVRGYAINREETAIAWYDVGNVYIADLQGKNVKAVTPPVLKGLVDYTGIDFTADGDEIVISCLCESGNVFQVLDYERGVLLAKMESKGADTRLLAIADDVLLLADGEKYGGVLRAWDYHNGETDVIYDAATGLYPESYITDAAMSPDGEWLALALFVDNADRILLIKNE